MSSTARARPGAPLLAVLVALLCLLPALGASAEGPSVIVLSWDGVRHDYPERDRSQLPGLSRMAREGARAERLIPVFPSSTFPNHVSLATGTYPDRHGIVANVFQDRGRGRFDYGNDASWIDAEPLWAAAERQGVPTAAFFWVGSETPWRGTAASYRRSPFDDGVSEREKVEQILAWLDLPPERRPRLILSWWHGADDAGHAHGPDSEDVRQALRDQDAQLVRLLAGLDARDRWDELTLVLVSDHGMSYATTPIDLEATLEASGVAGEIVASAAIAHVFLEDPARASEVAATLDALPAVAAFAAGRLPTGWRLGPPTRLGDVVCVTTPPNTFRAGRLARIQRWLGRGVGAHGYHPDATEDVHGILYALGRGVAPGGRLGRVRAIDVAATVAQLLEISPPTHSEGIALELQ